MSDNSNQLLQFLLAAAIANGSNSSRDSGNSTTAAAVAACPHTRKLKQQWEETYEQSDLVGSQYGVDMPNALIDDGISAKFTVKRWCHVVELEAVAVLRDGTQITFNMKSRRGDAVPKPATPDGSLLALPVATLAKEVDWAKTYVLVALRALFAANVTAADLMNVRAIKLHGPVEAPCAMVKISDAGGEITVFRTSAAMAIVALVCEIRASSATLRALPSGSLHEPEKTAWVEFAEKYAAAKKNSAKPATSGTTPVAATTAKAQKTTESVVPDEPMA